MFFFTHFKINSVRGNEEGYFLFVTYRLFMHLWEPLTHSLRSSTAMEEGCPPQTTACHSLSTE